MKRTCILKYPATCAECGAELPVGTEARYYGRGRVYGTSCHDRQGNRLAPRYSGEDYECSDQGVEDRHQAWFDRSYGHEECERW